MVTAVSIEPSPQSLPGLAAEFALLADPLRLQIVESLAREPLCTCHLIVITGAKQTTISNHLRILRDADIVRGEAQGSFNWYHLAPGAFADALTRLGAIWADSEAATASDRPAYSDANDQDLAD